MSSVCVLSSKTVTLILPPHKRGEAWGEVDSEATLARAHLIRDAAPSTLEQGRAWVTGCIWAMQVHEKDKVTDPEEPRDDIASNLKGGNINIYVCVYILQ